MITSKAGFSGFFPAALRSLPCFAAFVSILAFTVATSNARIGSEFQMALGNPSGAATDAALRTNYLIARGQYALSYNDDTHQANWVSWSYNSPDTGSSGRTDAWSEETALPSGYLRIGINTFGTGWDRGHMCPSGDRTLSVADNEFTFRMSNMIPQASLNNQGLWATFESYCRSLSSDGSEILIVSGPSNFSGSTLSNGMQIPGSVWKVALKVPEGAGGAATRVTTACRVLAIVTPNTSTGLGSWQSYITSVEQIEDNTGLQFFTDVDPYVATYLKNVVDTGTGSNNPTVIASFSPTAGAVGTTVAITGYNFGTAPVVKFNGVTAASSVVGPNLISAVVPSGATSGDITVTGTGGTDIGASQFTVFGGASPLLNLSIPSLNGFAAVEGSVSPSQSYTLSGSNLTSSVTVTAPTHYELSLDDTTFTSSLSLFPAGGMLAGVPIHVRLQSSAPLGTVGGTITHTGGGATAESLSVTGIVGSTTPTLALSTPSLSGFSALLGASGSAKSYTVSGTNLAGVITVTAPAGFELSLDNTGYAPSLFLTPVNGSLSAVAVQVRMQSSQTIGPVIGLITHAGGGAASVNLSVSGTVGSASGQVVRLAAWEVTGLASYGPSPFATTASDSTVTVEGLTRGSGITTLNTAAGSAWGGNGFDGTAVLADAITRGDFATFSITGATGVGLTFDSIPAYNIRRSGTGPTTGQWQYQVGTSAFQNLGTAITWGAITTSVGNPQPAVSLSGLPGLQDVPPGIPVTFRLVAYGASGATGNFYFNNISGDDLAVMGTASTVSTTTPVITSPYTAVATAYETFSYQITATNSPTSFAATGLPNGLSLNPSTGLISGTPLATGIYPAILTASNLDGDGTASVAISVSANPGAPSIGGSLLATGRLRAAFEYQVQASNSPTAWLASNLPPGLEINNTSGLISGTPTLAGTFAVPVTVQNAVGSDTKSLTLTIVDPTLNLTPALLAEFAADLGSASASQTYTVSGSALTGPVTVLAPEGFEISVSGGSFVPSIVLNPVNEALASVAVSVRLAASTPLGIYSGSIIHSGGGAIPKYLATTGTVAALVPTLALSVPSLDGFTAGVGSASLIQNYKLTGSGLTGLITVAAPLDYEISQDGSIFTDSLALSPSSGSLSTYVYVRLAATAPAGTPTGSITHTGGGASPVSLALSGTVSVPSGPVITSTTSGSVYVAGTFSHSITVEGTPTMVGYAASGLPAGLTFNTTTGVISGSPTTAGTSVITLYATSTGGTTSGTYTLKVVSTAEQTAVPLSVVVNKIQNSTTDRVELLAIGDAVAGPPVDLRGMILKDFNANTGSDLGGRFIFSNDAAWSAVKAGTLIVVANSLTEVEDLDPADFVLRVNLGNPAFFIPAGGGFDISNTDMVMLKPANAGVDGVAGGIHALAVGSSGSQYTQFTGRKIRSNTTLSTNNGTYAYVVNGQARLSDFYVNNGAGTSRTLTFGSGNNANNTTYINTLRALDQDPPVITLAGIGSMTVPHAGAFVDPGATALDARDGVRVVTTSGTVNTAVVGTYTITYTASDIAGNVSTQFRTVAVTDQTAPLLTLNGAPEITVAAGSIFNDPGATAFDAVDGACVVSSSGSVNTAVIGAYTLTYTATDLAGNIDTATRTVFVTDQIAPLVTLTGAYSIRIPAGGTFDDPGATATDAVDGTLPVNVTGAINGNVVGTYVLSYTATDTAGNTSTAVTRTIEVVSPFEFTMTDTYGLSGADAGENADPDGDGIPNLMEYVLGSNAMNDPNVTSPTGTVVGLNLVFTFTRADMAEIDTTQSVEWSGNMIDWSDIPIGAATAGAVEIEERGADTDRVTVTIPSASAQDGRLFTRLKVLKP